MSDKKFEEEIKKQLLKAMLTDDEFFRLVMADKEACQLVIRIITGRHDLILKEICTQKEFTNPLKRTAILDVVCVDSSGKLINIEMQRGKNVDHLRRVRFHVSLMDTHYFEKGKKFKDLPTICIIYISTFDVFKKGKTIYHVKPAIVETGDFLDAGIEAIFINTVIDDGSEQAELMRYFKSFEGEEKFPALASRVNYLKNTREGHMGLSGFVKKVAKESREEGRAEGRAEGEAKGRAEGEAKGRLEGRAEGEAKGRLEGRAEGEAKGRLEGRAEGEAKGRAEGEAKGRLEGALTAYVELVKNFIKSTGNSIEVAFKLLCIPAEMQPQVQKMI